jgi:hypothetical protein
MVVPVRIPRSVLTNLEAQAVESSHASEAPSAIKGARASWQPVELSYPAISRLWLMLASLAKAADGPLCHQQHGCVDVKKPLQSKLP